jgi:hypothetical protein
MAGQRAAVDREYVLCRLKENVERAMQVESVLGRKGRQVGTYRYDGSVANRALELLGKELGMFRDSLDITQKLDADPKKWTKGQLEKVIAELEAQVGPETAAAEREAAIREMRGTGPVQ